MRGYALRGTRASSAEFSDVLVSVPGPLGFVGFLVLFCFLKKASLGVLMVAQRVKYLTRILKDERSIPGLAQWVKGSVLP